MIVPPPKTGDGVPADAPPAYDNADASSRRAPIEKGSARAPLSPLSPSSSTIKPRTVQKTPWNQFQDDMGNLMADIGLGTTQHRVAREVRKTVTGLIHDLVRDQTIDSNMACDGILQSCSEICVDHSLNLPSLLQQPYIEDHTPLYWAIVKRPADQSEPAPFETPPLIRALLLYSAPLKESTLRDIRLACLHTCDQWLFQSLRMSPEFCALSHKDQLLLGVQVPPDTIAVSTPPRHDAPFTVDFELAHFQRRMRVSRRVTLDFISHARMWQIAFFVADPGQPRLSEGQWAARLALRENSPATNVSATYVIERSEQTDQTEQEAQESLELKGPLNDSWQELYTALPDAVQYPQSPFITAEGALRGRLAVQITSK
ncbi:hypothetical protein DFH07DRAFT_848780 [Mycena maculata]|uniref:Uncharacterized protein n=1 Tax=Mycena maculata TaxID=230809 RepID=A0AAD7HX80_9AGAR|nr:hypothetical protein DFH07DRAFT_848780 [Mycena maculata]